MPSTATPEVDAWWWSVLLLLWAVAPAQRVVDVLKSVPSSSEAGGTTGTDDESGGHPGEPLDEAAQRRLLGLLQHDPLLVATGGLRQVQRGRLLKRLMGAVEEARQVAADELVEALTQDMVVVAASGAGPEAGSSGEEDWQYKTFAYGPMPPPSCTSATAETSCCGEQPPLPLPLPLPPPLPAALVQRHVRAVASALGRCQKVDEAQDQHGGSASVSGDAACADADDAPTGPGEEGCSSANRHSSSDTASPCGLISLRVSGNLLAGSTGCHEWEASFALAQLVLRRPELFRGQRVLELGAGAGLVGVALARAGARLVAATDGSAEAVSNCAANLRLNLQQHPVVECGQACELAALEQGVAVCRLAWEEPLPPGGVRFDSVVASDVLYDPEVVPVLVSLLDRLLRPEVSCESGGAASSPAISMSSGAAGGAHVAYIATLRRNPATLQLFLETAAAAGLQVSPLDGWGDGAVSRVGGPHSAVRFHLGVLDDKSIAERIVIHRVTH